MSTKLHDLTVTGKRKSSVFGDIF